MYIYESNKQVLSSTVKNLQNPTSKSQKSYVESFSKSNNYIIYFKLTNGKLM